MLIDKNISAEGFYGRIIQNIPTVKSSISGRMGMVQPSGFRVADSCPIETKGSTLTVCEKNACYTIWCKDEDKCM